MRKFQFLDFDDFEVLALFLATHSLAELPDKSDKYFQKSPTRIFNFLKE